MLKTFWKRISHIGAESITNERLRRKIIISNQLAFTVGVLPIFTSLYLLLVLDSPIFFVPFIVGLLYMSTILLNKFKLQTFSRIYLTILPTINLLIISGFLSDKYSISMKIPYISIIVGPIILFDLTEKKKLWFGILWVVFMYYITDVINPHIPILPNFDPQLINNLMMINFSSLLCFIIFIAGFLYLQTINYRAEEKQLLLFKETQRQKVELEIKNQTITDSINYAKTIQTAVLSNTRVLDSLCSDYFIMYKPKDIVSGDFYMFNRIEDYLILVVADCTGHGVSGALMSMLGISYLNEIIKKPEIQTTNEVLDAMRTQIKLVMNQRNFSTDSKDGIDISIVVLNTKTMKAQYSGANRPLIIFPANSNSKFIEYKPDKMPVGIHNKEESFSAIDFDIQNGDTLYLFTDGYEDQFGGLHDKKMKGKTFREQLVSIQSKSMQAQHDELDCLHKAWKGNESQTDDILVVGLRF